MRLGARTGLATNPNSVKKLDAKGSRAVSIIDENVQKITPFMAY